jgi:DNA/RNA endonuclease G (NUC1)
MVKQSDSYENAVKAEEKIESDPEIKISGTTIIPESNVIELEASSYENNDGFNPKFLVQLVEMPKIPRDLLEDCAVLNDSSGYELKYNHFSIVMSKSCRLALLTDVSMHANQLRLTGG